MAATASQVVTIIADDLTGACDTGCLFAGQGLVGVLAAPALTAADSSVITPVITIDTESRSLPPREAAAAIHAAARRLRERLASGRVFKKIDSTLRGAAGVELTALLEHGPPFTGALVCPAFPAQRRVVRHGRLLVDSVPVHESAIARDPAFRGATSDVAGLLAGGAPVVPIGLDDVRAGAEKVAHLLEHHRGALVAADAETDADLATLAEAALLAPTTLIAGSAGLGRALSRALGCEAPAVALPPGRARLVVVGSLHPASRAQLDALLAAGVPLVTADARGHGDPAPAVAALAGPARRARPSGHGRRPADREAVARHLPPRPRASGARNPDPSWSPAATPPTRCSRRRPRWPRSGRRPRRRAGLAASSSRTRGEQRNKSRGTMGAPSRAHKAGGSAPPVYPTILGEPS